MLEPIPFRGKGRRLDDIDLPMVGRLIEVGEDEIHAVLDSETTGSGFDYLGRPKMLFEPHVFYRLLKSAGLNSSLSRAINLGIAYQRWGTQAYPRESYTRLMQAIQVNREIALKSASWGIGQVMGFNHLEAGFATVESMVSSFADDEENQLKGMIHFIRTKGLARHLRAHDWASFALGYNGPGFANNGYDKKLAKSFLKWQKIKDTPIT